MIAGRNLGSKVCDVENATAIGRNVRKPGITRLVEGDLGLPRAVGEHTPNLHSTGAGRVEPNVSPVGRVLGPVVEAIGRSEASFDGRGGRIGGYGVDVVVAIAFGAVSQRRTVGRPTVEVTGSEGSNQASGALIGGTGQGKDIDAGAPIVGSTGTDSQPRTVGRKNVVVITTGSREGRNEGVVGRVGDLDTVDLTGSIVDQKATIGSPIRGLDNEGKLAKNSTGTSLEVVNLKARSDRTIRRVLGRKGRKRGEMEGEREGCREN